MRSAMAAFFTSTEGQSFPGFDKPLMEGQIICSCPITVANPDTAKLGYQIVGLYPCQSSFFQYCNSASANTNTGSTIYVGAPTGGARLFTRRLYGDVPPINRCFPDTSESGPLTARPDGLPEGPRCGRRAALLLS